MNDEPTPIRADIVPQFDGEREMVDYLVGRVRIYAERWGRAPAAAAVVFLSDYGEADEAHSWTPGPLRKGASCARAAALLLERGRGG